MATFHTTILVRQHHALGCLLSSPLQFLVSQWFYCVNPSWLRWVSTFIIKDICVDSCSNPCLVKVHIKQLKTDMFRQGTGIYLGATDNSICSMSSILPCLALRGTQPCPFFITSYGWSHTWSSFCKKIDALLVSLQVDTTKYNTHSFHIGAATTATEAQILEAHIKYLVDGALMPISGI